MRFVLGLPTDHVGAVAEFGTGTAVAEMSAHAEAAGFDGVFVSDHPAPSRSFIAAGGHHTLDPMVVLAAAATATTTLRLLTNLYIVGYRNPFLAAKAIATLDNLSEGRVVLGVGAGYLEAEFSATGADHATRGPLLDRHLEVMLEAWQGAPVTASGPGYDAVDIVSLPVPVGRPGGARLPIWVGGNSHNALQRVVRFGTGWIPLATPSGLDAFVGTAPITTLGQLAARVGTLRELWVAAGRDGAPVIAIEPWDAGRFGTDRWDSAKYRERLDAMAEIGVTHVPVMLSSIGRAFERTRAQFCELASGFLEAVR